ncbi:uncharacterized protein PV09_04656 [Verruconis gallopava]|uniref:Heterokaryon incompatibility domain-containing protein n=1 Tax=Verruconis gallopava TaxID=253628 RepID=A0A0D1YUM4_9PEZI|nr:uncharacterized protein PV09_04656 [Verruconis gallopava]KIW04372.1 hypothetical protein PV09_04656 [Verruconis gallopava]
MEAEVYTPLPPQPEFGRQIAYSRLLLLYPGEGGDSLCCSLQVVDIENAPWEFEALSYVWGTEKSEVTLLCSNDNHEILGELEITKNLERALRSLRLPTLPRRLWIDAVCINQKDLAERARQVGYMRSVYKHAARVVVWLGEKSQMVRRAFSLAQELAPVVAEIFASDPSRPAEQQWSFARSILLDAFNSRADDATALSDLLKRDYFERVWCIQEVTAARNCVCKCEDLEMQFNCLLLLVPIVIEWRGLDFEQSGLQIWQLVFRRKFEDEGSRARLNPEGSLGPLLLVLMIVRNLRATNPRDRIFALLGCTDEGLEPVLGIANTFAGNQRSAMTSLLQRGAIWLADQLNSLGPGLDVMRHPALKPNYERSVASIYRDFARYCIRRSPRVLDVLSHVQHYDEPGLDEFPSWIAKFYEPRLASFLPLDMYMAGIPTTGHYRYFAEVHDNPLWSDSAQSSQVSEPDVLQADGFRVDIVEKVSPVVTKDLFTDNMLAEIWSGLFDTSLFPRQALPYERSNELLDVAFFMTLMAGGAVNGLDARNDGVEMSSQRSEAMQQIIKVAKSDLYLWLTTQPNIDISTYQDLVDESFGANIAKQGRFEKSALVYSVNRRVYWTRSGILGLGPKVMKAGDHVVALLGGKCPYILREHTGEWHFIGETYVRHDALMMGDEVTEVRSSRGKSRIETFRLK